MASRTSKERIEKAKEIAQDETIANELKAQAFKDWEAANEANNQALLDEEYLKNSPPLEQPHLISLRDMLRDPNESIGKPTLPATGTPKLDYSKARVDIAPYSPGAVPNIKPKPPTLASLMVGGSNEPIQTETAPNQTPTTETTAPAQAPAQPATAPPPNQPLNGSVPPNNPNLDVRMKTANSGSIGGEMARIDKQQAQIRADANKLAEDQDKQALLREVDIDAAQRQGEKVAAREQAYLATTAAEQAKQNAQNQLNEQHRQWYLQDQERKLQNLQQDVQDTSKHYWETRSTGQKIGLFLKAAIFGLMGAPEVSLAYIDHQINNDIAKQQLAVRNQETFLSKARERFGDERTAELAAKTAALGVVETNLKGFASQAKTAEQKQQANALLVGIDQKKNEAQQQLMAHTNATAASLEANRAQLAATREELALRSRGGGRELKTLPIDAANQLSDMRTAAQGVSKLLGDFKTMGPVEGLAPQLFTKKKEQYEALRANVARLILRMESGAAITKDEADDMKEQVAGASQFSGKGIARLSALYATLAARMNNRLDTYGRAGYDTRYIEPEGTSGIKTNTPTE